MATDTELPPCGLYRTTLPHPEKPDAVGANHLIHFHNHSNANKPLVLLPKSNEHNVWAFQDKGYLVSDTAWCHTLEPLPDEGLYVASVALQIGERAVAAGQLMQLGYNGFADPIVFFPTKASSANALLFPDKGMKVDRALLTQLRQVLLAGPRPVGENVN